MKILFLSFYFEPDLCAGSFRSTALISSLKNKLSGDSSIDVLTTLPNRYASFDKEANAEELDGNVCVHRIALPNHNSGMLDQSKAFFYYFKEVMKIIKHKEYDAVFATSSRLMSAFIGAFIAKKRSLPLFLDIRDIFVDTLSDVLPKKLSFFMLPFFSLLERWSMNRACHINLVSKGFEPYFHKRYPKIPLSFYSNGIDADFLDFDCRTSCDKYESNKVRVLYAGNIGEGQGLHKIIPELAKRLSNQVEFFIIGDGGRRNLLQKRVEKMRLVNVNFIDPVSRDELLNYYCSSHVLFLHLNDYQAFKKVLPSKLFEYGAMKKPIWAGVGGYAAEFVSDELDNAEVFVPCNVDKAIEAFNKLEIEMISNRERFIEKYSRAQIMDRMADDMMNVWMNS